MSFKNPFFFVLVPVFIVIILRKFYRVQDSGSLTFSSVSLMQGLPVSLRIRMRHVLPILLSASSVFLIIALARPRTGIEYSTHKSRGIGIMMVMDRSGSMSRSMGESRKSKMEISKEVFKKFIRGDRSSGLKGRSDDLIGLVTFCSFPTVMSPLTLSRNALIARMQGLEAITPETYGKLASKYSRTAMGDGIELGVARLVTAEERLQESEHRGFEIKSKVLILLTDGRNNTGTDPVEAAELAAKHNIKIYAIGIGSDSEASSVKDLFGGRIITSLQGGQVDMDTLKKAAEITGGFAKQATDRTSLIEIYKEIDKAEKTEIKKNKYVQYKELYRPFLITGLSLFMIFIALYYTFLATRP